MLTIKLVITTLAIPMLMAFTEVKAANFHCANASTKAELLICDSLKIMKLDAELNSFYAQALTLGVVTKKEREIWYKALRDNAGSEITILKAYELHIKKLKEKIQYKKNGSRVKSYNSNPVPDDMYVMYKLGSLVATIDVCDEAGLVNKEHAVIKRIEADEREKAKQIVGYNPSVVRDAYVNAFILLRGRKAIRGEDFILDCGNLQKHVDLIEAEEHAKTRF